jgi:hypothetical protein
VLGRRAGDLIDVASPAGRYRTQILAGVAGRAAGRAGGGHVIHDTIPRGARRTAVTVAWSLLVMVGLALLVLPGPGLLLLTAGLALLATEFAWASAG